MKEFLDNINSLKLEYPELETEWNYILDMCLTDIENGVSKEKAISMCEGLIKNLLLDDENA